MVPGLEEDFEEDFGTGRLNACLPYGSHKMVEKKSVKYYN
jgi:hypothetical protein